MGHIPSAADVVVIGGGPAGTVAAAALGRRGFSVVLLEKVRHPRPNVGESVIPDFWKYTDDVGASEAIEAEGFICKGGGLTLWQDELRQLRFSDYGYERPALHVERDRFDLILLRNARECGVQVFEETNASRVGGSLDEPVVHYRTADRQAGTVKARYVVDASGQSALLAKQLGVRKFDPDIRFMSLWGYYVGGRYLSIDGVVHPFASRREIRPATVVANIGGWGWVWHIVLRESVSVGLVLPPERLQAFKAAQDTKEAKFQGLVAESPIVGDLMRDAEFTGEMYGIRDYAYKPVQLAAGSCYMAGDAAAFVDPINSAGVVFAMYAGFTSAWSIAGSLHSPARREDFRATYCNLYGGRLSLFRLLGLPADSQGTVESMEAARAVIKMLSETERELMLHQATNSGRPAPIAEVLKRLGLRNDIEHRTVPLPQLA